QGFPERVRRPRRQPIRPLHLPRLRGQILWRGAPYAEPLSFRQFAVRVRERGGQYAGDAAGALPLRAQPRRGEPVRRPAAQSTDLALQSPHQSAMRLMTWNVQWCRGIDERVDPARIAAEVKRIADPDVVCMQEIGMNFPELPGS